MAVGTGTESAVAVPSQSTKVARQCWLHVLPESADSLHAGLEKFNFIFCLGVKVNFWGYF